MPCLDGFWLWQAKKKNVWSWIRLNAIIRSLFSSSLAHIHRLIGCSEHFEVKWNACFNELNSKLKLIVKIKRLFSHTHRKNNNSKWKMCACTIWIIKPEQYSIICFISLKFQLNLTEVSTENLIKWDLWTYVQCKNDWICVLSCPHDERWMHKMRAIHFNWLNSLAVDKAASSKIQFNCIESKYPYTAHDMQVDWMKTSQNVKTWPFCAIVTNNKLLASYRMVQKKTGPQLRWTGMWYILLNNPVLFGLHSMRSYNEMLNNKKDTKQHFGVQRRQEPHEQQTNNQWMNELNMRAQCVSLSLQCVLTVGYLVLCTFFERPLSHD